MVRDLWQDTRYGARMLRKSPGLTLVALLSLALGMGAISTIFSFVNGILLRPLPYPHSERLVLLDETAPRKGDSSMGVSYPNFLDWRVRNQSFEDIACYDTSGFAMAGGASASNEPEQIKGAFVNQGLFEILGVAPILGRTFTADEDQPDHDLVVIVSYGLWQRRFGGDPNILGQTLIMNNRPRVVIGVMPKGFQFPEVADAWGPLALTPKTYTRTDHGFSAIARLKPGVSLEQAQAEMTNIAAGIEAENPVTNEGLGVNVINLRANLVGDYKKALLILLGVVAFVLLIACVNVANLLLARATARQKEIAIRAALGADRKRIFRQLLTESLLLGLISGALGLVMALWGMELLLSAIPIDIPFWMKFDLDGRVLGFTAACSLLTGFVFGTVPALEASNPDLNETLKEGGRAGSGGSRGRLRSMLVVAEIALSLVLLVGAGLMMRSFISLQNVDPGINPKDVLTFKVNLPGAKYRPAETRVAFFQRLLERVRALPSVLSAGSNSSLPLAGDYWGRSLTVEGFPVLPVGQAPTVNHFVVSPSYFEAMGIRVLKGRDFDERDTKDSQKVTIIDERLARQYWPDSDPIGKRVRFGPPEDNEPRHTIVGVVGEVWHERLDASTRKSVYLPFAQMPVGRSNLAIRTSGRPENLISAVRAQVKELDPDLPIIHVMPMTEVVSMSIWQPRLYTALFGVFAAVALILAMVGIYGVMSYAVSQRTREIGLRMALGAERKDVLKLVVGQGIALAAIGVGVGLVLALGLTRLMSSLLFGVGATDPITFAAVSVLLTGVALGACFVPARRAARVDPMVALRYE
jgi:putative ABC transport system permease protein